MVAAGTYTKFEAVIGLEVHAQLLTETKLFCGCPAAFGGPPNTHVCPVCLGHPGVLPVLNAKAVEYAVLMGLATGCRINPRSVFARKNYFYPDLPKGFQTSQYDQPICQHGFVDIQLQNGATKKIGITRIHIEEDAGKSLHEADDHATCIDANRCGVPLIEIVSEPELHTPSEASAYLTKIHQLVQYLGICDGNMEEGSFRCDANISIRPAGQQKLGTKTEIKNMNSFRNVERALVQEIERQKGILEAGGTITQETLLFNADSGTVQPMRSKEDAHDYRYFPEPDLMPVAVEGRMLQDLQARLPELPEARRLRFTSVYGLPEYDASLLTQSRQLADYFEAAAKEARDYKSVSNWVMVEVLKVINERKQELSAFSIPPAYLGELVNCIASGIISNKIAKEVFAEMLEHPRPPKVIITEKGLMQVSDTGEISTIIGMLLAKYPAQAEEYRNGSQKILGFFVGQVMKETKGRANPVIVNQLLEKFLSNK